MHNLDSKPKNPTKEILDKNEEFEKRITSEIVEADKNVDSILNTFYAEEIKQAKEESIKRYLSDNPGEDIGELENENWSWEYISGRRFHYPNGMGLDHYDTVRTFARMVYFLKKSILEYRQIVVDGASGVILGDFLEELIWQVTNEHENFIPAKRFDYAGGQGMELRLEAIKKQMDFDKFDSSKRTLLLTELSTSGQAICNYSTILPREQTDCVCLTLGEHIKVWNFVMDDLFSKLYVCSRGNGSGFYSNLGRMGTKKDKKQEHPHLNTDPDSRYEKDEELQLKVKEDMVALANFLKVLIR